MFVVKGSTGIESGIFLREKISPSGKFCPRISGGQDSE
jgi:hypothetical protein